MTDNGKVAVIWLLVVFVCCQALVIAMLQRRVTVATELVSQAVAMVEEQKKVNEMVKREAKHDRETRCGWEFDKLK